MTSISPEGLQTYKGLEHSAGENTWVPKVKIKPHHLVDPEIQGAIIGKNILAINMDGERLLKEYPQDVVLYQADSYGVGNDGRELLKPIKTTLSTLKDKDIVQLDIERDEICNSCVIGKHCNATNYMLFGINKDVVSREKIIIDDIHQRLIEVGHLEGIDFSFKETHNQLLDYGGKSLWEQDTSAPITQTVTFLSMLVRVEALRKIFAR